jgi:hypothetical protein
MAKEQENQDYYVEEACYYLSLLKIKDEEIASAFNLGTEQVRQAVRSFSKKLELGKVKYDDNAKDFWSKNFREGRGDFRITLVDDKGSYYHGWKSELEKMETEKLVAVLATNKDYCEKHPLSEFSKGGPVIGYDPLAPLRDIRKSISIIEEILERRERKEEAENSISSTSKGSGT